MPIPLADINGQQLDHWVRRAWLAHAPEPLAQRARAAESAKPGAGDLPRAIGAPATRALAAAGITTLDQVAALTEAQLLALHGMGPKAVRILRETLADKGRSLADSPAGSAGQIRTSGRAVASWRLRRNHTRRVPSE